VEQKSKAQGGAKGLFRQHKVLHRGKRGRRGPSYSEKREAVEAGRADSRDYDFELWASLDNWKKLATGDMGPKAAMLTKRLKFKGSMITAMKYMSAFEDSLKMMGNIPTDWDIK
jgi:putative sterol carrier protein